jgi:hypothetical protein
MLVAAFAASGDVYADKEFLLQGTVDCGLKSGARCTLGDIVTVWTSDVTGTRQRMKVDVSWIRKQLDKYDQDDLICLEVRMLQDGTLQGLGVSATCGAPDPKRRVKEDDDPPKTVALTPAPQPLTDLALTKDGFFGFSLPPAACAQQLCFSWTITITNESVTTATGVTVIERPALFTILSGEALPSVGTYDDGTNIWTVGTLAPGQTETLELFSLWTRSEITENCAEVQSASPADVDSVPSNGASSEDDQACASVEIAG